jgi:hypothetical protein
VGPGKYEIDLSTLMAKWKERLATHRMEAEEEEEKDLSSPESNT